MEMVDSLMNKIDEFDNKIGVTNNKKASLELEDASTTIANDFSIPTEIIYQKEKNDYSEWQSYFETSKNNKSTVEAIELTNLKVRQENEKTSPNIKNKAFYINLNDVDKPYEKERCIKNTVMVMDEKMVGVVSDRQEKPELDSLMLWLLLLLVLFLAI